MDDLKAHMDAALKGNLPLNIYLSSIDCGLGKTSAVYAFLRDWKASGFTPDTGIIILLSRVEEIENYIRQSGLSPDDYAVLISKTKKAEWQDRAATDSTMPSLGRSDRGAARILFTTQQMYENRVSSEGLGKTSLFQYAGKPRSLALWDESYPPAKPIMIRLFALQRLQDHYDRSDPEFVTLLETFLVEVRKAPDGLIPVPLALGMAARSMKQKLGRDPDKARFDVLDDLERLSGRNVLLFTDRGFRHLIGCGRWLPQGDVPIIVTDASIRVREAYNIFASRGRAQHLVSATADYKNLHIHWWDRACSKHTLGGKGARDEICDAVAGLINAKPEEPWLVIHHLQYDKVNIELEIRRKVAGNGNVSFVHWGNHHGSNAYRHIKNVIVIGLWIEPEGVYRGRLAAAKGTIVAGDMEDELKRLRDGEHRHNLMQAICRSNVRNHVGDVCGEATVYIIADKRHEPDRLISETFPGCHIHRWEPVEETLKGAELAVFNAVLRAFEDPSVVTVSKGIIGTRIGLPDKQAMRRILQKDGVKSALKPFGIGVVYKAFVRIVDG